MIVHDIIPLHEGVVKGIANRYKKWKDRYDNLTSQKKWDDMSNKELFAKLEKAEEILSIKNGKRKLQYLTVLQREARTVVTDYILPQFRKRGLKKPKIVDTVYEFPHVNKKK